MAADAVLGAIVGKFVEKIWDYTVDPILRQFSYICCFNRNIEKLQTQLEELQPITQEVHQWVDAHHLQLRVIPQNIVAWLKRADDVEMEVEEIIKEKPKVKKGCLNGRCPNLKWRYSLSRKAVKKTEVIVDLQKKGGGYTIPSSNSPPPTCLKALPCKDNTAIKSRSVTMEKIIEALKDDKINLIGICGLPGVGKTTMAKEIAKRAKEDGLFVEVASAVVSQTADITNVQACIANMLGLKQFGDNPSPEVRADHIRERLLQDNKKILVILDDIWAEFDLEDMGIPLGGANKNFKMVYTSRNRGLWHEQITKIEVPLELLSKDEAWELFKKQVGDCANAPDLQPIAKEIVNSCGCLPLALVLIGKALSKKSSENFTKINIWEDMRNRLTCSSSTPADMSWSSSLELSYRAVEDEEAKRLFLLCCLFEEDKSISIEVLARYAWGFSLFDGIKRIRNARDRIVTLVADLESRYLLLDDSFEGDVKHVKVHDLVRDMGISIASKCKGALGSHGTVSEYPKKDACEYAFVRHRAVSKWPNKDKFQHYTCISVISKEITEFPEELTCPNLEFLLLRCRTPEKLSCHFFKGTEKLKVLELYEHGGIIPTLQPLTNLTMLSLEGLYRGDSGYVPVIEPVIGYLLNLEILSFRYLGIEKLPEEIGKLIKLRLLDLTWTSNLETIPPCVISRLVRLEELYMMESKFSYWEGEGGEKGINANLREFELLSNLNTLEIRIRSGVLIPKVPIFSKLKKYKVIIAEDHGVLDNWSWYFGDKQYKRDIQYERKLYVERDIPENHGVLDSLLRSSDQILLRNNDLLRLLDGVDRLQQLKFLKIVNCKTPECLVNTMNRVQQQPNAAATAVFPTLEKLCLHTNDGLRGICHDPIPAGSFGQLTEITIYDCNSLKHLFPLPIVEFLTQLKILSIQRCATMEEVIWKEQREDVHIAASNRIEFSKLESLVLGELSSLMGFCRGIDGIDFPRLKDLLLYNLGKLKRIVHDNNNQSSNSEPNNNVGSLSLFPQMVTFPSLEKLYLHTNDGLKGICHGPIPAGSFGQLTEIRIYDCNSLKYLFPLPIVEFLTQLKILRIQRCATMEEVIWKEQREDVQVATSNRIEFSKLESLFLDDLSSLVGFCRGIDRINFPRLIDLHLRNLGKLKRIVHDNNNQSSNSEPNNNVGSLSLFPQMVTFPSLEKLVLSGLKNVSNELPAFSLSKLKELEVFACESWRNVFYPSMATVLVNLQTLTIMNCSKMETIVDWEEGHEEREIPKTLFPQLMNLELKNLPRLTRFCHFTRPIELPLLSKIDISGCCSMKEFFFGPMSTPNFYLQGESRNINHAIEFMQEERRKEEEQRKEAEEMAKGKGWPMKVKHEFHEHDLELIQRLLSYTCDGCEEGGKDWSFCCKDCDFDLHPKCALEENKATKGDKEDGLEEGATTKGWPKKVKHELHEHELELIKRWNYICDGCKELGKLWFFYCKDCDFYLHRKCALEENKATERDYEDGLEE